MTCATLLLATAIGQLPVGTCALQCEIRTLVAAEERGAGWAMGEDGRWFRVYRINGSWSLVLEQEPMQCQNGITALRR